MTNSSASSLRAKCDGDSLILRLTQSCFITSSTVSVGSIRVRTVRPSAVVTLFVGTRPGLACPPLAPVRLLELEARFAMRLATENLDIQLEFQVGDLNSSVKKRRPFKRGQFTKKLVPGNPTGLRQLRMFLQEIG